MFSHPCFILEAMKTRIMVRVNLAEIRHCLAPSADALFLFSSTTRMCPHWRQGCVLIDDKDVFSLTMKVCPHWRQGCVLIDDEGVFSLIIRTALYEDRLGLMCVTHVNGINERDRIPKGYGLLIDCRISYVSVYFWFQKSSSAFFLRMYSLYSACILALVACCAIASLRRFFMSSARLA